MAIPIWKDHTTIASSADSCSFDFRVGGSIIYQGTAVKKPSASGIVIRWNDVVADYLGQQLPVLTTSAMNTCDTIQQSVSLYVNNTLKETQTFYMDWSYTDAGYAQPTKSILGRVDVRQPLFYTTYKSTGMLNVYSEAAGIDTQPLIQDAGTLVYTMRALSNLPDTFTLEVGENNTHAVSNYYEVCRTSAQYALLYVTAWGGWDSFLLEGHCTEGRSYTRHTAKREYSNATASNRGTHNYATEEERTYTLRTGWLSDAQSRMMPSLLGSTDVYLYDLDAQTATPVLLTDTATEVQTYKGNGLKLVQYTIGATVAREMTRR